MPISLLYTAVVAFALGVGLASLFPLSLITWLWLSLLGLGFIFLWWHSLQKSPAHTLLWWGVILLALALGGGRFYWADNYLPEQNLQALLGEKVELAGTVTDEPEEREAYTRVIVKVGEEKILLSLDRYTNIKYGDELLITGKLSIPKSFTTDLGRTFDYPGYLRAKGIKYQISFAEVKVERSNEGNWLLAQLYSYKQSFLEGLRENISVPASGLGEGLLLGVKNSLGEDLETIFRQTGIIHIVVLSGYNIMLVVIFIMFLLGNFLPKFWKILVGIVAIWVFALIVGMSSTVVRACLMVTILLLTTLSGRNYLALRGLLLAGLIMITLNPHLLVFDVGFQLSFLATLGLILLAPHLEHHIRVPKFAGIKSFLIATLATQIAVTPFLLYQVGEFSVVAVLVNILVLPMVPLAMLLTFATGLSAGFFPALATVLSYPTYFSLAYIIETASLFARLPFASYAVTQFSFYLVLMAYLFLGLLLWRYHRPDLDSGFSEIAERWIVQDTQKKAIEENDLSDWVIEEEEPELDKRG